VLNPLLFCFLHGLTSKLTLQQSNITDWETLGNPTHGSFSGTIIITDNKLWIFHCQFDCRMANINPIDQLQQLGYGFDI
jgi:hypothetical protein